MLGEVHKGLRPINDGHNIILTYGRIDSFMACLETILYSLTILGLNDNLGGEERYQKSKTEYKLRLVNEP